MLESLKSADRSAICSAMEGRGCMQGELETTLAKLRFAKRDLNAIYGHIN